MLKEWIAPCYPFFKFFYLMDKRILALPLLILPFTSPGRAGKSAHYLKHNVAAALKNIPEPSGIVWDSLTNHLYIVSDHGKLFECDTDGVIIRKAKGEGGDFEAVEVKDSFIYVSDESPRKVYQYRKTDLSLVNTYTVTCGGAINRAYESITYNRTKNCFILVSQQPVVIVEYTPEFKEKGRFRFKNARDISDAKWHNGWLYLLSNLDACIIKCDPQTYEAIEYYKINVLNPEGIGFRRDDKVLIVSDNAQKLYQFNELPKIK